jgi:hypothetical protein
MHGTRRFALELGQHGITVNAVAPGFVRTDLTQRGRGAADWPGTEERFAARAMMGRIGEPEDIANAVVFLASPESGWITAQVLTVDAARAVTVPTGTITQSPPSSRTLLRCRGVGRGGSPRCRTGARAQQADAALRQTFDSAAESSPRSSVRRILRRAWQLV